MAAQDRMAAVRSWGSVRVEEVPLAPEERERRGEERGRTVHSRIVEHVGRRPQAGLERKPRSCTPTQRSAKRG